MFKSILILAFISTSLSAAPIFNFGRQGLINAKKIEKAQIINEEAAALGGDIIDVEKTNPNIYLVSLDNNCSFYAASVFSADQNPKIIVLSQTTRCNNETIQD